MIGLSHGLELVFGRSDVLRLRRGMNLPRNLISMEISRCVV